MRYNPPPNWPTPPAGWTPPPGWRPEPTWPPAPPGWQFWIADDPPAAIPGYSPQAGTPTYGTPSHQTPSGYAGFGPTPGYAQPGGFGGFAMPPTNRAKPIILAIVGVVAVIAVVGIGAAIIAAVSGPNFAVGDCVLVTSGLLNDDMEKTSCRSTTMRERLDGEGVYKIVDIRPYLSSCHGRYDVTFNHEPDDRTYCLTEY